LQRKLKERQMDSPRLPASPRDKILHSRSSFLQWLNSPQGDLFNEYLIDILKREEKRLHNEKSEVEVFRAQGATAILNTILDLHGDIEQYEKDLIAGKVQPIVLKET
jgi:hypothetical protein